MQEMYSRGVLPVFTVGSVTPVEVSEAWSRGVLPVFTEGSVTPGDVSVR